jgi:predicted O-methyltransferase YrrM
MGSVRKGERVSSNPHEDMAYLSQDDTPFLSKAEISKWEEGKTFSTDWAGHHFFMWSELLQEFRRRPVRILEIGSWEGRSALYFLNYLPHSRIVCIDPFSGSVEHHQDPHFAALALESESQFDANLAAFSDRLEKIKGNSTEVLPELGIGGRRFDLAYIDGSHMAADVYRDGVLTWSLMNPSGIVIWDDYGWELMDDERERPKLGVDAFLRTIDGRYRELHRSWQIAIQKT